jgi:DNA-directed RNA polymerase specialized sigma subunit
VKARREGLSSAQWAAVVEALPKIHELARKLARRCPRMRPEELETMAEDFFFVRALRWDPSQGKLFPFARKEVTLDVIRTAHHVRDPALEAGLRATVAQENAMVEPDTAERWAESIKTKRDRALAMGLNLAIAGLCAYGAAHTRSPEDEYGRRESFEAMKRAAAAVEPRAAELLGLRYEQDLTWEEVSARLDLDLRQAQRIEARVLVRLRAILGAQEQHAP